MKKILFAYLIIFFIGHSCKKSSSAGTSLPPGNPNNEVKATVSIKSGTAYSLIATGNSTVYAKRTDPNGDVVITVLGSSSQGAIHITLVNINLPGTYTIGTASGLAGEKYILGSFEIGNALLGPYEPFFVQAPPSPSGTITLDELTANSVRGSFSMTCVGSTGTVKITNGTFKGTF